MTMRSAGWKRVLSRLKAFRLREERGWAERALERLVLEDSRHARYTEGEIDLGTMSLRYSDVGTVCPQWKDIFVRECLHFQIPTTSPRILDCGANIGLASLYFKRLYPEARITAFEPDQRLFRALTANLRRNGAGDVEAIPCAVWHEEGTVWFHSRGDDSGRVDERGPSAGHDVTRTQAVRLRTILEREPVDVLKVDIEGGEASVLPDCAEALKSVQIILMEVHEFDPRARQTGKVFDCLSSAGFTFEIDDLYRVPGEPGEGAPFRNPVRAWSYLVRAWRDERGSTHP